MRLGLKSVGKDVVTQSRASSSCNFEYMELKAQLRVTASVTTHIYPPNKPKKSMPQPLIPTHDD